MITVVFLLVFLYAGMLQTMLLNQSPQWGKNVTKKKKPRGSLNKGSGRIQPNSTC